MKCKNKSVNSSRDPEIFVLFLLYIYHLHGLNPWLHMAIWQKYHIFISTIKLKPFIMIYDEMQK